MSDTEYPDYSALERRTCESCGRPKLLKYVTGDVDEAYLNKIEQARNDASKVKTQAVSAIIDLYNN